MRFSNDVWNCHKPENTDQIFVHKDLWQRETIHEPTIFSTHVLCAYGHSDTFAPFNVTDLVMAHVNHGEAATSDSISVCRTANWIQRVVYQRDKSHTANINLGSLLLSPTAHAYTLTNTHTHSHQTRQLWPHSPRPQRPNE